MPGTCVLVHGVHLHASNFEDIIWGAPFIPGRMGRIPKALQLVMETKAELIYWVGSTVKDDIKEADYLFQYALTMAPTLAMFWGQSDAMVRRWIGERSFIDVNTINTADEIRHAGKECLRRGISHLVLVSSPTHIVRALRDAMVLRSKGELGNITISAQASDTCFADSTAEDVVVIEPHHRPDLPNVPFNKTAKRIFPLLRHPELAAEFNTAWEELIERFEAKLPK